MKTKVLSTTGSVADFDKLEYIQSIMEGKQVKNLGDIAGSYTIKYDVVDYSEFYKNMQAHLLRIKQKICENKAFQAENYVNMYNFLLKGFSDAENLIVSGHFHVNAEYVDYSRKYYVLMGDVMDMFDHLLA